MNHNVSSVVRHVLLTYEYRLYFELTIELQLNHFDFVVAAVSVDVFQHDSVVIPPLVVIGFRHTTANMRRQLHFLCKLGSCQTHLCQCWMSVTGCCCQPFPQLVVVGWPSSCAVGYLYYSLLLAFWHPWLVGCQASLSHDWDWSWLLFVWRSCVVLLFCDGVLQVLLS